MSESLINKTLITITSCNRLKEVKKYFLSYIDFCNNNKNFSFLLSLDGKNNEYVKFCSAFEIPLLYSEEREGVGISKNRVLKQFPDFDHYFFIDDDIELINSKIFETHIQLGESSPRFYHISSTDVRLLEKKEKYNDYTILFSNIGGGYFNYFNKKGLDKVGGWHTNFAKYKRYGHTEHTHRFKNAGITDYPFTVISECINDLILHNPGHVTEVQNEQKIGDSELFEAEQKLIAQKLAYFPITTLSEFHFNGFDLSFNPVVDSFLRSNSKKYPLTKGIERLKCFSSYYFFLSKTKSSALHKLYYFCLSVICNPINADIKHAIKSKITRK